MYEHNALGYWSGLALCLTKVRSSRARCPATALIKFALGCICVKRMRLDSLFTRLDCMHFCIQRDSLCVNVPFDYLL